MEYDEIKKVVFQIAEELAGRGVGWAQESVVVREAAARIQPHTETNPALQQAILTAWHDLFLEKKLSWGYDLDNPSWPFYHLPLRDTPVVVNSQPASAGTR